MKITGWLLTVLLGVSLFFNLGYGVLWNDEAETAMYAQRILQYGYPKVHDGKNVLNVAETEDLSVGVKESLDAWIYISSWGQYYFAAPFVYLVRSIDNIHLKTFYLRFPFTLLGFIGLLIFARTGGLLVLPKRRVLYTNLFLLGELLSIPMALHLREMRHYALTVFVLACIFWVVISNAKKSFSWLFQVMMFGLLFALLNIYLPALVGVFLFLGIWALWHPKKHGYLLALAVILIPYLSFFEFGRISAAVSREFNFSLVTYLQNLKLALTFFIKSEYLWLSLLLWPWVRRREINWLWAFWFLSLLVIVRVPYFFERYVIYLQPVAIMILALSLVAVYDRWLKLKVLFWGLMLMLIGSVFKVDSIIGHVYELTHPYLGPVDYLISYLQKQYVNSEKLVIATNYEEYSLMYYLDAKVVVGYVGNNLNEDQDVVPDIVIKRLGRPNNVTVLDEMLSRTSYQKTVLDVWDYPVNNLPEGTLVLRHLYKIPKTNDSRLKLTLYEKLPRRHSDF